MLLMPSRNVPNAELDLRVLASAPETQTEAHAAFQNVSNSGFFTFQLACKRLVDLILVLVGLLLICPLLLSIALVIKVTSPGPILYKSLRIGKRYKPFYMYKFRTMQVDADSLRDKLREEANLQGNLFKLANDPRVTPVGKVLRAFSLDELPQLFNVLRGEMSLVGPRPLPPDESDYFEGPYTLRFQVTPGLTGAWQINGRSKLDFKKLCQLELTYVMQWSILEDLRILFKTVPVVLKGSGAY